MDGNIRVSGRDKLCHLIDDVIALYKKSIAERKKIDLNLDEALRRSENIKNESIEKANITCKIEKENSRKNIEAYIHEHFINKEDYYIEKNNELLKADETYNYFFTNDNNSYESYESYDLSRLEEIVNDNERGFIVCYNYILNAKSVAELEGEYQAKCKSVEEKFYGEIDTPLRIFNEIWGLSEKLSGKSPLYYKTFSNSEVFLDTSALTFNELCEGIIKRYEEVSEDDKLNKYAQSPKRRGARETKKDFKVFAEKIKEANILYVALKKIIDTKINSEIAVLIQEKDNYINQLYEKYRFLTYYYKNIRSICRKAKEKAPHKIAETERTIETKREKSIEEHKQKHIKRTDEEKVKQRKEINDYIKKVSEQLDNLLPQSIIDEYTGVSNYIQKLRGSFNISYDNYIYQMFDLDLEMLPECASVLDREPDILSIFHNKLSDGFEKIPFVWTASDKKSLLIKHDNSFIKEAQEMVCSIIIDFLSLVKIGSLSINKIDKAYDGKSISLISDGLKKVPDLINNGIKTGDDEIAETIERLYEISEGHIPSDKKELLIINGYPSGIDDQTDSKLISIFNRGIVSTVIFINTDSKSIHSDIVFSNREAEEAKLDKKINNYERNAIVLKCKPDYFRFLKTYLMMTGIEMDGIEITTQRISDKKTVDNIFMAYAIITDREKECDSLYLSPVKNLLTATDESVLKENIEIIKKIKDYSHNTITGFPKKMEIGSLFFDREFFKRSAFYDEICKELFTDLIDNEIVTSDENDQVGKADQLRLPLNIDLSRISGFLITNSSGDTEKANGLTNYIIWSFLKTMPVGKAKIAVFDSIKRGENIRDLLELREQLPDIFTIDTSLQSKKERLHQLNTFIDDRIQKKLFGYNNNIFEYNDKSEKNQEIITILMIYDFPEHTDDTEYMKLLEGILENGAKCGIITFFCCFNICELSEVFKEKIYKVKEKCLGITCENEGIFMSSYGIKMIPYDIPPYESIRSQVAEYADAYKNIKKKGILFDDIKPEKEFQKTASDGLSIPVGIGGGDSVVSLNIGGDADAHHGLIIGGTGSGKSTLLHTIIMSGIINYGPDELNLYLLDFKSGTEFKVYEEFNIPHIKYLGLDAMQEYGVGVLEGLKKEMDERADKFKKADVRSISEYKKISKEPLPRIMILIDEFQILFDQGRDYKLAAEAGSYATDIIKQGRSYGIHLIMATQSATSISSGMSLDKGTIEQMRLRIALSCSDDDLKYMFTDNPERFNDARAKMSGPIGSAVINHDIMNTNVDNIGFRVSYCESKSRNALLGEVGRRVLEEYPDIKCDLQVFDANKKKNITDFFEEKSVKVNDEKGSVSIYIGEPVRMSAPCVINMDNKNNRSLIVCGSDTDMRNSITDNIIISALLNNNTQIMCIDGNEMISEPVSEYYTLYEDVFEGRFRCASCEKESFEFLKKLNDICVRRYNNTEEAKEKDKKYFLILRNFQFLEDFHRMLKREGVSEDMYDEASFDPSENPYETGIDFNRSLNNTGNMDQKMDTIIMRGGRKGIYTIIDCDDSHILSDALGFSGYIKEFKEKIVFMEDNSEAFSLGINDNDVKMSNLKRGMVYHVSAGQPHIIKPFDNPGNKESLLRFFESLKLK